MDLIEIIKQDLLTKPSRSVLLAARYTFEFVDECPTWIMILALGDLELWEAVIDVAKSDLGSGNDNTSIAG